MKRYSSEPVILIIDDNPSGLYVTAKALTQYGFNVITASTGREALLKVKTNPDIILLDVMLPDINGLEVCRRIKADPETNHIPIIHLSACYIDDNSKVEGLESGADLYLIQPVDPKVLKASINSLLRIKRAEDRLKQEEIKFRTLSENSPDAIGRLDTDLRHIYVNPVSKKISGLDITGKSWREAGLPEEFVTFWESVCRKVIETGEIETVENSYLKPGEDDQSYFLTKVIPETDTDGNVQSLLIISTDISKSKNAEKLLQESEEDFRRLFDNSFDAIFLTSPDGSIKKCNRAAEKLFGYTEEEFLKLGRNAIIDPSDPNLKKAIIERETTGRYIGPLNFKRKDGTVFTGENRSVIFKSKDGSLKTRTTVRDITDILEKEREVKRTSKQLQEIIDGSPAIIFAKDLDGRFIIINKRLEELLGISNEELKGKTDFDIFPKEWAEYYQEHDRKIAETREPMQIEEEADLSDGIHHTFMANKFPLLNENGKPYAVCGISTDITDYKKGVELLNTMLERFYTILSGMYSSILLINSENIVEYVNQAFCDMYGFNEPPETIRGITGFELFDKIKGHYDNPEETLKRINELISCGLPVKGEEIILNGNRAYLRDFVPIIINGKPHGRLWHHVNITERKKNEQEKDHFARTVENQRLLLEVIITNLPAGVLLLRGNELVVELVNDIYQSIGPGIVMLGKKFEEVWPEPYSVLEEVFRQVLNTGKTYYEENASFMIRRSYDGPLEEAFFTFSLIRIAMPGSNEWGILNTVIETTTYVKANKALKESESRLHEAQKLANLGSFTYDFRTKIFEWTKELYDIYEIDPAKKDLTLEKVSSYHHPEDREYINSIYKKAVENNTDLDLEYRIITGSGKVKYVNYIARISSDSEGIAIKRYGTIMDITGRKLQQIELEKTLEELQRSNKELEQFAYVASHDLQEPLRMISNFAKLLENRYKDKLSDQANELIWYITDGAKRMSELIRDLLSFSRLSTKPQSLVKTDLNELIANIRRDLHLAVLESGIKLEIDSLPEVIADPTQMKQLFQNLIQNAIKFRSDKNPFIKISSERKDNEWLFSVKDNGIGIKPEYHERIFLLFQRLHERDKYSGTGIGLTVCRKIVERHGGKIWLESKEGKGSTFYFTLK